MAQYCSTARLSTLLQPRSFDVPLSSPLRGAILYRITVNYAGQQKEPARPILILTDFYGPTEAFFFPVRGIKIGEEDSFVCFWPDFYDLRLGTTAGRSCEVILNRILLRCARVVWLFRSPVK